MARLDISGFAEVEKQILQRSERASKAVRKMVQEGAIVLAFAQIDQVKSTFKGKRSTGELAKSIGASPIKTKDFETFTHVYPRGKDSKGVENATKGFVLHYGRTSRYRGRIPPSHWVKAANEKAAEKVHTAMRKAWEDAQDG